MIRCFLAFLLCSLLSLATALAKPQSLDTPSVEFDYEVLPILTRTGCNAGSCHGAAVGRGGFHLSLWGSNPQEDHLEIAREFEGRRLNIKQPVESLFLKKPTGTIDHEGGAILDLDSRSWKILHDWIQQGGQRTRAKRLTRLEIQFNQMSLLPDAAIFLPIDHRGTLAALAHFESLPAKDVNHLVAVTIPDASGLKFDLPSMQLTALRPGIHTVTVRYGDQVHTLQVLTPEISTASSASAITSGSQTRIDLWLDQRREILQQQAVPAADDATLLRRVMLDLVGRAPTAEEIDAYVQNLEFDKYERLIERLMISPEYVDFWTYHWTRVFGLRPNSNASGGLQRFYQWMYEQISAARSWDAVTRELITASGDCHEKSPAFFMLLANDPRQQAEQLSRLFMGVRMECANCHDHPLDRWKQDDYHGLAAVFARIDRKQLVRWLDRGAVTNPRTGLPAIAQLPGGPRFSSSGDVRSELATWMIEHPDALLARATVNRIWFHFFGRGLVQPVDDMRLTNPATHPQLLHELTEAFRSHQYDVAYIVRQIVLSSAYRRQAPATAAESQLDLTYNFGPRKTVPPDVLLDLIDTATGSLIPISNQESVRRAIQLQDPTEPSQTLDALGRCSRSETCQTTSATSSLTLMLHWINGETLNDRIRNERHWLNLMLQENLEPVELYDRMYLRTLCRYPQDIERTLFLQSLKQSSATERKALWEDLFWALLASKDFLENR